ncbi:MAG TPA: ferritin-like domain-containing protein [Cyclobacteriaceae bacterium]
MAPTSKKNNTRNATLATGEVKTDLLEFFTAETKDIYWAENYLIKTLPKMQEAATSQELKDAFAAHLEQTKNHVKRLEKVFDLLEKDAKAKKCDAMEGIVDEGEEIIEETDEGTTARDVGLIMAAQKVEHYEIATYGGLIQIARTLAREDIAEILDETLREEKETDVLLTDIAESHLNYQSVEAEE